MADDEIERIKGLCDAKRRRLAAIERQIALFGEAYAPPHLLTERAELREAVAKYETVLGSPVPTEIGDELGVGGRFTLVMEEFRRLQQAVALHGVQLSEHIAGTTEYREKHAAEHTRDRRMVAGAVVAVALILAFFVGRMF